MSVIGSKVAIISSENGEPYDLGTNQGATAYFQAIDEYAQRTGKNPKDFCPWEFTVMTRDGKALKFHSSEATVFGNSRFGEFSLCVFPGITGEYNGLRPVTSEGQGAIVNIFGYDKAGEIHLLLIKEMRQSIDGKGLEESGVVPVFDKKGKYAHYQEWHPPMGFSAPDLGSVATKMMSLAETVVTETGEETGLSRDSFTMLDSNDLPINMNASCNSSHNSHVAFLRLKGNVEDCIFKPKENELVTGLEWFTIRQLHELNSAGIHDNALLRSGPAMAAVSVFISAVALEKIPKFR